MLLVNYTVYIFKSKAFARIAAVAYRKTKDYLTARSVKPHLAQISF